jgi:hypothetical protein
MIIGIYNSNNFDFQIFIKIQKSWLNKTKKLNIYLKIKFEISIKIQNKSSIQTNQDSILPQDFYLNQE